MHLMIIAKELKLSLVDQRIPELEAGINLRSKHDFIMAPELKSQVNAHLLFAMPSNDGQVRSGTTQL
jgi:hypothetical protein